MLEPLAFFLAGFVVDVIATLSFIATVRDKAALAALSNFGLILAVDISYFCLFDGWDFEHSFTKMVAYAAGAAAGTYVCLKAKKRWTDTKDIN